MLAAGTDDWLDELAVGVLIRALHQLLQALAPVRRFIIRAGDVERTDGIVSRTHHVDGVEAQARHLQRVAHRRRFSGQLELAKPAPDVDTRRAQLVRRRRGRHGADDDRLCRARRRHFLEQTIDSAGPVADAVGFAAPETVRGEGHEFGLADERRRHGSGDDVEGVIAADASKVEDLRPPVAVGPRRDEVGAKRLAEQCRHDVTPRIEVGGDQDELAESGLPEIFLKDLRIPPAEGRSRRLLKGRGAADELPDRPAEQLPRVLGLDRRSGNAPPPGTLGASPRLLGRQEPRSVAGCAAITASMSA